MVDVTYNCSGFWSVRKKLEDETEARFLHRYTILVSKQLLDV